MLAYGIDIIYGIDTTPDNQFQAGYMETSQSTTPETLFARRFWAYPGPRHLKRAAIIAPLSALLLWYLATGPLHLVPTIRFPSPADTWAAAVQLTTTGYAGGTLLVQAWHSTRLVLLGFACASTSGVLLGAVMGISQRMEKLLNPSFLLLRPIPPLAWIPLAILWFGLGDLAKIFVIWYAAFVPSVINTLTGLRSVDQMLISAARVHGASQRHILLHVMLPSALPMIFAGLKLSLQACWTTLVAAELVGAFFGLGRVLISASQDLYPGMILFAMFCIAALGAGMTFLLSLVEKKVIPWRSQ